MAYDRAGSRRTTATVTDGSSLHAEIKVRMPPVASPSDEFPARDERDETGGARVGSPAPTASSQRCSSATAAANGDGAVLVETTLGRLLFNEAFPPDFPFRGTGTRA